MKNLLMAAALGATALIPISAHAQTAQQPAQQQQMGQQQPAGQMQDGQVQQLAVADLMNRDVVDEQGQPVGTVAGIVSQEGAEPHLVIEMQQDQAQFVVPMDRISMQGEQIVVAGFQDGTLTDAQQFGQEQQAQYQPVDEQQQVPVRTAQPAQQQMQQPAQQQQMTTAPVVTGDQQQQPVQQQQMAGQEQLEIQGGFVVRQGPNQILGSNLMNADVLGATGEDIGNVDDVLMDSEGRVLAIIVGVGGFLGIGSRDVAIPMDALNFVTAAAGATAADGTQPAATGAVGQQPATVGAAGGQQPATGTADPAATGTTAQQQPAGTATTGTGWGWGGDDVLQHIEVAFTREQLENAPEFTRYGEDR